MQKWTEIHNLINKWFNVDLLQPKYEHGIDTNIICEYKQRGKSYDIIAGGSGFHQVLTLLAFLYGYNPDTILLDEPDAHLHVNLQREVIDYFKSINPQKATKTQFLIATHAEEFIESVEIYQIYSLLSHKAPKRVEATAPVLTAMSDISNLEVAQMQQIDTPIMLYVEGEDDERLIRAWAKILERDSLLQRTSFYTMHGGSKKDMQEHANNHFRGLRQIQPAVRRIIVLDYDSDDSFHPSHDNQVIYEWRRKNIENYLLVMDAWIRAASQQIQGPLFLNPLESLIRQFFENENLILPPNQSWRTVDARLFRELNGKKTVI